MYSWINIKNSLNISENQKAAFTADRKLFMHVIAPGGLMCTLILIVMSQPTFNLLTSLAFADAEKYSAALTTIGAAKFYYLITGVVVYFLTFVALLAVLRFAVSSRNRIIFCVSYGLVSLYFLFGWLAIFDLNTSFYASPTFFTVVYLLGALTLIWPFLAAIQSLRTRVAANSSC